MTALNLEPYFTFLERADPLLLAGRVSEMVGLLIESEGPSAAVGDFCEILTGAGRRIRVQVIGFRNGKVLSMPLEETGGIQLGDAIVGRSTDALVHVGPAMLGRV